MASGHMHLMFFYGTLKKGERNYGLLSKLGPGEHAKFIAECTLKEKYPLVVTPELERVTPALLHSPGVGKIVEGELYEVDDAVLVKLDNLKGHPDFYTRTKTVVINKQDASEIECEVYFMFNNIEELIALPHISNFAELNKPKD